MQTHGSHDLVIAQPLRGTDDEITDILTEMAEDSDGRLQPQITPSLDRISTTRGDTALTLTESLPFEGTLPPAAIACRAASVLLQWGNGQPPSREHQIEQR